MMYGRYVSLLNLRQKQALILKLFADGDAYNLNVIDKI
jgi:hypothetical protein